MQDRINGRQRRPSFEGVYWASLLLFVSVLILGCGRVERGHQVRTQGDLQYLVPAIEGFREEHGFPPTPADLAERVGDERLVDVWGRPIQYATYARSDADHYVLASLGRDGRLDVDFLEDYLDAEPGDVSGQYDRDIVVVDGRFVRNAGK